jgi:hypothetical protein
MSVRAMNRVWEASRQSGGALLVLLAIADFADDDGVAYPSIGTLARKARLSPRQVQRVIADLVAASELIVKPGGGRQGSHLFRVAVGTSEGRQQTPRHIDAPDNLSPPDKMPSPPRHRRRDGVTPVSPEGVTPASSEPSYREPSRTATPLLPSTSAARQQQGDGEIEPKSWVTVPPEQPPPAESSAQQLVEALYHVLGVELAELTPALRTRELAIADQLVRVGATAAEAQAYAREAGAADQRLAPIDLRSFERERASWLARQRGSFARRRYVDRTGQGIHDDRSHAPPMSGGGATSELSPAEPTTNTSSTSTRESSSKEPGAERLSAPLDWSAAVMRRLAGREP